MSHIQIGKTIVCAGNPSTIRHICKAVECMDGRERCLKASTKVFQAHGQRL